MARAGAAVPAPGATHAPAELHYLSALAVVHASAAVGSAMATEIALQAPQIRTVRRVVKILA